MFILQSLFFANRCPLGLPSPPRLKYSQVHSFFVWVLSSSSEHTPEGKRSHWEADYVKTITPRKSLQRATTCPNREGETMFPRICATLTAHCEVHWAYPWRDPPAPFSLPVQTMRAVSHTKNLPRQRGLLWPRLWTAFPPAPSNALEPWHESSLRCYFPTGPLLRSP